MQLEKDERPRLGPLFFVMLTTAFTGFHQDLFGSVDSVHYCHSGCNEVVMLCRLDQTEKLDALEILFRATQSDLDSKVASKRHWRSCLIMSTV